MSEQPEEAGRPVISRKQPFDIKKELFDWSGALVNSIVAVVLVFAFAATIFNVDGVSMRPTLEDGEMLVISNLFYTPKAMDIVMFSEGYAMVNGETGREIPLVKRIIAVGGETVRIDYGNNSITVNGTPINNDYILEPMYPKFTYNTDKIYETTVPPGHVFVLGDNRNHSEDSRSSAILAVDERYILGRVLLRLTPLSRFGPVNHG